MAVTSEGLPSAVRGFGLLAGANALGQALGFLALAIVTRRVGAAALGNYNFAYALAAYFGLLGNLGVSYVGMRDVSTRAGALTSIVGESLTIQAVGAVIAYGGFCALAHVLAPSSQTRALIPIVGLTFVVPAVTLDWVLLGLGVRAPVAAARLVGQVVYAALVPIFVTGASSTPAYAWLNVLGLATTGLIVAGALANRRGLLIPVPGLQALWTRLSRSAALGYSLTMIQLYNRADIVILGYLTTARQVGLYAIAYRFPYALVLLTNVWLQATFPHAVTRLRTDPAAFRSDVGRILTAAAVVAMMIVGGAAVFPSDFMATIFGASFAAAGPAFVLLSAGMALVLIEAVLSNVLIAASHDRVYALIVTGAACVNIGLNIVLIPLLAAVGSALATLITEATLVVVTLTMARRVIGLPRLDWPRLGLGACVVCLSCSAMAGGAQVSLWVGLGAGITTFTVSATVLNVFDPALWRRGSAS